MADNISETSDLTPFLPHKIDRSRASYFTHKEQLIMLENFENFREIIKAKGNTAAQIRAREECWRKIAESVNTAGSSSAPRSWQQIKTKYKNLIQSAHRRRKKLQKGIPSNDGPHILETLQGCLKSDPELHSPQELFVQVDGDTMVLVEPHNFPSPQTPIVNGEAVPVFSETPLREPENMQPSPESSTSRTTKSKEEMVEADSLRALKKKNIELDNIKKELEIKKLTLEIEKLEYEKRVRQTSR